MGSAPPVPSPSSDNLPLNVSSFVGREREISEVKRLLGESRLVTLTGPGGCGKTRLATEVARALVAEFEDGVWLVELAPLSDSLLVPETVASVLGARERSGLSLTETLTAHLGDSELLLVLDNCEHLIEACAELAEALLRFCPDLRILATSREALGIGGESNLMVPPLSLPDPRRWSVAEGLGHYEATRLFIERASAAKASFALTGENAAAVARVCYRLDGIPLAIEIAAARVKSLSVGQIYSRLEGSFELLKGGSRTAEPRQRTVRGAIDWSHDLLPQEERVLLRRLSVFSGGFSLEAAEEVCGGEEVEKEEVLELLVRLVDKSLVMAAAEQGGGGEARYQLLETVRQYGAEKLGESGESGVLRGRHARFFLSLAEEAERKTGRGVWMERLAREHDNMRAALGWALESGEAEVGLRLAGALGVFWNVRGHLSEGRRWLKEALDNGAEAPEPLRARTLVRAGWLAREQGDYERSAVLTEECLTLARRLGDKAGEAAALSNLAWTALFRNELERAVGLTEEVIPLQREMGDTLGVAFSYTVLGFVAVVREDYERAMTLTEENLALARKAEDDVAIALSLTPGALASLGRGDYRRAWELCEGGIRLSWRLKMMHPTAAHIYTVASLSGAQGQSARAARLWGAAQELCEGVGISLSPMERLIHEPYVAAARAWLGEEAWEAAWAEGRRMPPEQAVEYALEPPSVPEPQAPEEEAYPAGLSAREAEVLELVAGGLTSAQVARELFISPNTVNRHLSSIYAKLGVSSRAAATRLAMERGLTPSDSSQARTS